MPATDVTQVDEPSVEVLVDQPILPEVGLSFSGPVGPEGPEGPAGPEGPQGPQGIQGPAGEDGTYAQFSQVYSFASPSTMWTIEHGQNKYSLSVVVVDTLGDVIDAEVDYPDLNTITVSFYYPMTGAARVFG
jgi:hypothetical protein